MEYWSVGVLESWSNGETMRKTHSIPPFSYSIYSSTYIPFPILRMKPLFIRLEWPSHFIPFSHPKVLRLLCLFAAKFLLRSAVPRGMEVEASTGALHSHSWQFDLIRQSRFATANGREMV